MVEIRTLDEQGIRAHVTALSKVLTECVDGGASVSFMEGFSEADASLFFEGVARSVGTGERLLLAAFFEGALVGTVQLILRLPPNQPHRGEIAKLLVSPSARRLGVGRQLMQQAETEALRAGRWLLVLDTVVGSPASRLYDSLGWQRVGDIPNFARFPDGSLCGTTFFYKDLQPAEQSG